MGYTSVIVDKRQGQKDACCTRMLANAGVPVRIDTIHRHAHNKVMIIDGTIVVTESFNFTENAETHNAENLLLIKDQALAARYTQNWRDHESHSSPYTKGVEP